ncbi:MAG: hypothetical protein II719_02270, partial [Clostridia bacterium]|nr:hypothetical protein [Clostridia bacterium]
EKSRLKGKLSPLILHFSSEKVKRSPSILRARRTNLSSLHFSVSKACSDASACLILCGRDDIINMFFSEWFRRDPAERKTADRTLKQVLL